MCGVPPEQPPEGELALRATQGDRAAVVELLANYMPRLRAFVRLRLNDALRQRESKSDVVQSVCREVLEGAGQFRYQGEERFRAWLFTTALNKIRERARYWGAEKRAAHAATPVSSAALIDAYAMLHTPSQVAIGKELAAKMERAFDELSEEYREVITLIRIVGLSHHEAAAQMNRSEGATRMLLSRALVALVAIVDRFDGRR